MRNYQTSKFIKVIFIAVIYGLNGIALATQSDTAKELRWAEQIIDALLEGEEVWLDDGNNHEFLGILTEAENKSDQAVILVHGIGVHPDWPDVIHPLRVGLPIHGLATLSIQMPVLANDAQGQAYLPLFAEVPDRFKTALDYLHQQGYDRISIVAHSLGATMSAQYLTGSRDHAVESFVAIGMGPGISNTAINSLHALENITIPMLDIYGSADLDTVLKSAPARAISSEAVNRHYSQMVVEGANHFFQGFEKALVKEVASWLHSSRQ